MAWELLRPAASQSHHNIIIDHKPFIFDRLRFGTGETSRLADWKVLPNFIKFHLASRIWILILINIQSSDQQSHSVSSPVFWEARRYNFSLLLIMLVEAAISELLAEPGITIPFCWGGNFSKIIFDSLFHIDADLNTKFCLLASKLTKIKQVLNQTSFNKFTI